MLRAGDTVFLSDNSEGSRERSQAFVAVVQGLKLRPVFYTGLDRTRTNTNVAREFRRDMYASKVIITHLGPPTQDNNIVFDYLPDALLQLPIECLLYAAVGFDRDLLSSEISRLPFRWVPDLVAFESALRQDLEDRLERLN